MQPYGQSSSSTVTVYAIKENVHADEKTKAAYQEFKKLLSSKDTTVDFTHLKGDRETVGERVHADRPVFIAAKDQKLFDDTSQKKKFVFKELSQKAFDKKFPMDGAGEGILSIDISDFTKTTATTKDIAAKTLSSRTVKTPTRVLDSYDNAIPANDIQPIASERKKFSSNVISKQLSEDKQQGRAEIRVTNDLQKLEKSVKKLETYNKSGIRRFFSFGQPGKLIKEILTTLEGLRTDLETYPIDDAWMQKDATIEQRLANAVTNAKTACQSHEEKLDPHTRVLLDDHSIIILNQVSTKAAQALTKLRENNDAVFQEEDVIKNLPPGLSKDARREQQVIQATKLVPLYITNCQLATKVLTKESGNQEARQILQQSLKQLKGALTRIQKDYDKQLSSYQQALELYNKTPGNSQQEARLQADFKRLTAQNDLLNEGQRTLESAS